MVKRSRSSLFAIFPVLTFIASCGLSLSSSSATAQVVPDQTLGTESSQVVNGIAPDGIAAELIQSGARRGENLFHSFEQFSIGDGQRVYFGSVDGVERIISRVTGNLPSEIFGTLDSSSAADLFLINPQGIVFGPNARLNVGGSFVASTADELEFADVGGFSARNPEAPSSLLTIRPSALAFGQISPGTITAQSTADDRGLQVPDGESLVLLGGNVLVLECCALTREKSPKLTLSDVRTLFLVP